MMQQEGVRNLMTVIPVYYLPRLSQNWEGVADRMQHQQRPWNDFRTNGKGTFCGASMLSLVLFLLVFIVCFT